MTKNSLMMTSMANKKATTTTKITTPTIKNMKNG